MTSFWNMTIFQNKWKIKAVWDFRQMNFESTENTLCLFNVFFLFFFCLYGMADYQDGATHCDQLLEYAKKHLLLSKDSLEYRNTIASSKIWKSKKLWVQYCTNIYCKNSTKAGCCGSSLLAVSSLLCIKSPQKQDTKPKSSMIVKQNKKNATVITVKF